MAEMLDENGNRIMCIGPLCTIIPSRYHQHLSKEILKSYLACNEEYGSKLQKQMCPADVPVIVREYTANVYPRVLETLNEFGKNAVEDLHPWILCTLIDWDDFDSVICNKDEGTSKDGRSDSSHGSAGGHQAIHASNTKKQLETERLDEDGSTTSTGIEDAIGKVQCKWPREKVLELINLHVKYEDMFLKPSTKKKFVWGLIASELSTDSFIISGEKVEQKWKNITKAFRDTNDHNKRSGNEPKRCQFYDELQEAYGYRPNITPVFTSTAGCTSKFSTSSDTTTESNPENDIKKKEKKRKSNTSRSRSDDVVVFLQEIKSEMAKDHEKLLETLEKQHLDRMKNEEKRLKTEEKKVEVMSELINVLKR